jgi:hypothetical protein
MVFGHVIYCPCGCVGVEHSDARQVVPSARSNCDKRSFGNPLGRLVVSSYITVDFQQSSVDDYSTACPWSRQPRVVGIWQPYAFDSIGSGNWSITLLTASWQGVI